MWRCASAMRNLSRAALSSEVCQWRRKCWPRCERARARPRFANFRCRIFRRTRALMKMEVAGICGTDVKLYKTPADQEPRDHGAREYRHHCQGRPRVHQAQGLQGGRSRLRRALRRVRQMRMVPSRPIPPLREHGLALQPRRHPLRLYLGRESSAPLGRVCPLRVPAMERGACTTCRRASRRSSRAW